ncbi:MAG: galactokinase [Gemmatimonadota bacterium]
MFAPAHVVHAPGRVNLIGEHIDYCGLPVLPMAIPRGIRLRLRPRADAEVRLTSADARFGTRRFALGPSIEPYGAGDWGNYAKAAAQALLRTGWLGDPARVRGLEGRIESDLPVAAGLSSSSALVVACALGLLAANGRGVDAPPGRGETRPEPPRPGPMRPDRLDLARLLARAERYVGTAGGGMDQAVCLLGREGAALRIEFAPLAVTRVSVPEGWVFLVAHSLRRAEKSGAAGALYNRRTAECRKALRRVRAALGSEGEAERAPEADRERSPAADPAPAAGYRSLLAGHPAEELLDVGRRVLSSDLFARFRHVVTEAGRVDAAQDALERGDLPEFGACLAASHASLRGDYGVSTPELDELVELMEGSGAVGARLTGAGMGGCAIGVCERDRAPAVMDALAEGFYRPRSVGAGLSDILFTVRPAAGASVMS